MLFYIAQAIGFVALTLSFISFQQKTQKRIVMFLMMSTALFAVQFYMLGAGLGVVMNIIAGTRAFIYFNKDKKWASGPIWMYVFIAVSVAAGIAMWENMISVFPISGMIFTSVSLQLKNPKYIRIMSLPSSPLWFIYDFSAGSYFGALCEVIATMSILIAMFRYDFRKKRI